MGTALRVKAGVTVIQNDAPGATSWPGSPTIITMPNPSGATVPQTFTNSGSGFTTIGQTFSVTSTNYILQSIEIYAGGGVGFHFVKFDNPFAPPGFDNSKTKLGLNIQGGIKNQVMPNLGIFGEVKYVFVSDVNQLKIMGGFTYNFIY